MGSCRSKRTAVRQVPACFRKAKLGRVNLDVGGGPYGDGTAFLRRRGVRNVVHDPCHGREAPRGLRADSATLCNVLNVIPGRSERLGALKRARAALKPGGKAYIQVHEGDGSCKGKPTSRGYQRNCKLDRYEKEVRGIFGNVERRGRMLVARRK